MSPCWRRSATYCETAGSTRHLSERRWSTWLLDGLRLALLVGAFVTLALGPREQSFRLALTFLLVLVPRQIHAPRPLDLLFIVAMSFQAWGNVFGAFDHLYGYDKIVHFLLPCAASALLYLLLVRAKLVPDLAHHRELHVRAGMVLVTFALGLTAGGGLYEMYEWFADNMLGANLHVDYGDSIADLADDSAGSLLGGALLVTWSRAGWGSRRGVRGAGEPDELPPATVLADVHLPRWLVGDWHPLVRDGLDVVRWSFAAGAVASIASGDAEHAVRFALTGLAALGVRRLDVPRLFDLAFVAAMAFQSWGRVAGGLEGSDFYEGASHVLIALAAAIVLYLLVVRIRLVPDLAHETNLRQRAAMMLVAFALGFSTGIWYEIYLYVVDHLLDAGIAVDYGTLIRHLALDVAGALGGGALLLLWDAAGWGTLRRVPAARLV